MCIVHFKPPLQLSFFTEISMRILNFGKYQISWPGFTSFNKGWNLVKKLSSFEISDISSWNFSASSRFFFKKSLKFSHLINNISSTKISKFAKINTSQDKCSDLEVSGMHIMQIFLQSMSRYMMVSYYLEILKENIWVKVRIIWNVPSKRTSAPTWNCIAVNFVKHFLPPILW